MTAAYDPDPIAAERLLACERRDLMDAIERQNNSPALILLEKIEVTERLAACADVAEQRRVCLNWLQVYRVDEAYL